MDTPKIFLAFIRLDKSVVFFTVSLFGWFSFPCPFVACFLFLFFRFLGGFFLAAGFLLAGFSLSFWGAVPCCSFFKEFISAVIAMIFSWSSMGLPHAFSSSKSLFILVFGADHKVFCGEGCSSVVTLTPEVFDVDDKLVIWGGLEHLPQVVEKVHCLLLTCVESAHLFADPLIEFGDISLENQQLALGFYQHFPYVHGGGRVVHHGEDDDLLEER